MKRVKGGDGALQFNIQELQTIVRNNLAIKILLLNNRCHPSVRQLQEKAYQARYPTNVWGYDTPNFCRVAEAYGIPCAAISETHEIKEALKWSWRDPHRAALLEVIIPEELSMYPIPMYRSVHRLPSWNHLFVLKLKAPKHV